MINLKNKGEELIDLAVAGTQAVANDLAVAIVPFKGFIRGIFARLDTAGTVSGTQITDVKLNGSSIFSGATKLNFAAASKTPTYGALTTALTTVNEGDTITLHTTAVNGTPGKNLAVAINIRRGRAGEYGTDTDTLAADSTSA